MMLRRDAVLAAGGYDETFTRAQDFELWTRLSSRLSIAALPEVFYAWRPNLPDEADNHLIELAVAAQASAIVTRNLRDVSRGELKFPWPSILTPEQCLEVFPCPP
jgi:predicted nucleic acid-binding protein